MNLSATLISRYFDATGGELRIGGLPIRAVAEQFGTPLFIYDETMLDRKWSRLRQALPDAFDIYYSVKANPVRAILQTFLSKGCGLEVASAGELVQAIQAGCPPDRILFAGPGKTDAEIDIALKHSIGEIHIESMREADRIQALSRKLGVTASVSLRINPASEVQGGAMRMGGKPAAFGIDEEELESCVRHVSRLTSLTLRGLHLFTGTQILDAGVLARQYRKAVALGRQLAAMTGTPPHTIDFGGGLGIPYFDHEGELDTDRLRDELVVLMSEVAGTPDLKGTRFIVEPGRYLVGESGIYVARVTDVKISRGKTFVILDGGMHHHLAASGNLGQVIKRNFPLAAITRLEDSRRETVDLTGPLCTPLDTVGRDVALPPVQPGDLIGIFQAGAYARSASPLGFLSHPTPPEILISDGQTRVIRRRGTVDDMLADIPA
jgi:diaminopimelate decarboxylase